MFTQKINTQFIPAWRRNVGNLYSCQNVLLGFDFYLFIFLCDLCVFSRNFHAEMLVMVSLTFTVLSLP